jgi:hypothetical protein
MPCSDILNPQVQAGVAGSQFSKISELNPDYGYQRKRPVTHQVVKPKSGPPSLRDISDVGHSFMLTWQNRPLETIRTLKRYYEQYRGGFFTYIDWEGGGRHYVGHFSAPIEPIPAAHGRWSCQAQFDEVPLAPMLKYPSDWAHDAIWIYALDDWGYQRPDTSGTWTIDSSGNKLLAGMQRLNGVDVPGQAIMCDAHDGVSWAQIGYFGYGFQLVGHRAPNLGMVDVWLDGALLQAALDLYTAAPIAARPLLTQTNVPLGLHRVKLVCNAGHNVASSDYVIYFEALQVMR